MVTSVFLRSLQPHDSVVFTKLASHSPDGGQFQIAPHFHLDAYTALRWPYPHTTTGVAAVAKNGPTEELVGAGLLTEDIARIDEKPRSFALLHDLVVHPDYRQQGIASQLAAWRIAQARQNNPDIVILALIQQGNAPSLAVARHWCTNFAGPLVQASCTMRSKEPSVSDLVIRPPNSAEFTTVAEQLNAFYASYQFYSPHSAASLSNWLASSPFPIPHRHYRVAVDAQGRLVAGAAVIERYRLKSMRVRHAPRWVWWINRLLNFIPATRLIRPLSVSKVWFAPDHRNAARAIWETVRWEWRKKADSLLISFDPSSSLSQSIALRPWWPKTRFYLALSEDLSSSIPIYAL